MLKIRKLAAAAMLLILLSCAAGWCGSIEIANASFEEPADRPMYKPFHGDSDGAAVDGTGC